MLDYRNRRLLEELDVCQSGVQIHEVVIGQLFSVELNGVDDVARRRCVGCDIVRAFLVRVFAVTKNRRARVVERQRAGEPVLSRNAGKVVGNSAIVFRRMSKRRSRQLGSRFQGRAAVSANLFQNASVLRRVGRNGRKGVVFRRRSNQRRTADIDLFNRLSHRNVRLGNGFLERIEVNHDQLEGQNAVFFQTLHVRRVVVPAQNSAEYLRVKRLQTPVHHFRKSGIGGNFVDVQAVFLKELFRSASRVNFNAAFNQTFGEFG